MENGKWKVENKIFILRLPFSIFHFPFNKGFALLFQKFFYVFDNSVRLEWFRMIFLKADIVCFLFVVDGRERAQSHRGNFPALFDGQMPDSID